MPLNPELAKVLATSDDAFLAGRRAFGGAVRSGPQGKQQQNRKPDAEDYLDPDKSVVFRYTEKFANMGLGMGAFAGMMLLGITSAVSGKLHSWGVPGMGKIAAGTKAAQEVTLGRLGQITGLGGVTRGVTNLGMSTLAVGVDGLKAVGVTGALAGHHGKKLAAVMPKVEAQIATLVAHQAAHPEVKAALDKVLEGAEHVGTSWVHRNHVYIIGETNSANLASMVSAQGPYANVISHAQSVAAKHGDKALIGHLKKFSKLADKAQKHFEMKDGYENLGKYTREAAPAMAQAPALHGALNAGILAGTAISAYRTGYGAHKGLKALCELYCDTTGKKPSEVSTFTLLFGEVPQPVRAARGQYFKEFGPAGAMESVNAVLNGSWAITGRGSMILLMGLGLGSQLIREALAGNILPTYTAVKDMQKRGEPVPADAYATLAGEASKELRVRGGAQSDFAVALGKVYEKEQITLHDLMAEISDGRLKKRLDTLQAEFVEHKKEQANMPHKAVAASVETPLPEGKTHAQRLTEPKQHKVASLPVLGEKTQKLHDAALAAQQHPTHSVSA